MAAAAETLLDTAPGTPDFLLWEAETAVSSQPEAEAVRAVPALEIDAESRERAARFIGRLASDVVVEHGEAAPTRSLLEALHRAHAGEAEARRLVEMNVRTDVIERTIKAGHVMKVRQEVNERGQVLQHGQTAEEIQANSLRYAAGSWQMRQRIEAETRNMFRIEALQGRGLLKDNYFVVFSRAADNMTPQQAAKAGFFTDTMSLAAQATTAEGQGLTTESAFVAGKPHVKANRQDAAMVAGVAARLGVDLAGKTATQLIDTPLLIPKRLMSNGVIDVARWLDEAAGGTFFGQDVPTQDYLEFRAQCQQREAELEPTVQTIVAELIAQSPELRTPLEATQRLGKLSGAYLLRRAVTDEQIDGLVFGIESAAYLEAARLSSAQGDSTQAAFFLERAVQADDSSSCPGAGEKEETSDAAKPSEGGEGDGDCDFISKKCPLCGAKNVRTLVRKLASGQKHISGSCGCSKLA